jgi:transcriptional regulator with XRE-family HTH domain
MKSSADIQEGIRFLPIESRPRSVRDIVAHNIRTIRRNKRWSQEALGAIIGVHRTHISLIERAGSNFRIDSIEKIAAALEVSVDRLFER